MKGPYDDILHLPRPVSDTRPPMPPANRAAQFLSFAALSGFDGAIEETARTTDARIEPGEAEIDALNEKLRILADRIDELPEVSVTYFQPDDQKEGGRYVTAQGTLRRILDVEKEIVFTDGRRIGMADILDVDGEQLKAFP